MKDQANEKKDFWHSLSGTITKISGLVVAIGGLLTALNQIGLFSSVASDDNSPITKNICYSDNPCYIICESAFKSKQEAQQKVVELTHSGYNKRSGFLWIPDYDCLSGNKFYQVYIGPFESKEVATNELCEYNQKFDKIAYGVKICDGSTRVEFRCN